MYYNSLQTNYSESYDDQWLKEEFRKIDHEYEQKMIKLRDEQRRNSELAFGMSDGRYGQCICYSYRPHRSGGVVGGIINAVADGIRVIDRTLDNNFVNYCASSFLEKKVPVAHVALEALNAYKACARNDFPNFASSVYSGGKSIIKIANTN